MPSPLAALSPLDGRYARTADPLRAFFSEQALIRYRVRIELAWLQALAAERGVKELKGFSGKTSAEFGRLLAKFSEQDAEQIKRIEAETNHDVKAIEYWLRSKLGNNAEAGKALEFIHFACTSEDINNLSYALMMAESRAGVMLPRLDELVAALRALAKRHAGVPMLSRTHGQPASPTTLGKEMANFAHRLGRARERIAKVAVLGKANGAVGNYNAHAVAYPDVDWERFSRRFVEKLGLEPNPYTTQIDPHDWLAELLDAYAHANSVLLDLDRDHFENSEGNIGVANALLRHLADKLPVSRWQRDLSDSTAQRNIGTALGHTLLAYAACQRGLAKLEADPRRLADDLDANWEVLTEAVQQVMRRHGVPDAYDKLKELSRGKRLDRRQLAEFVKSLPIPPDAKKRLLALTPAKYTGLAADLAKKV
jgi:adenylosuccinate lyase